MIRMKDIAEKCGVSRSAVSFVLNGHAAEHGIAESTCELVRAAAKQMEYCPNELARAVATGRNRVAGIVISSESYISDNSSGDAPPDQDFTMEIIEGALETAAGRDYSVKLFHAVRRKIPDLIRAFCEQMIAGMLFFDLKQDVIRKTFEAASKAGIKCGVFNMRNESGIGFGVCFDDAAGISGAVRHLVSLGHSKIALVSMLAELSDYVPRRNSGYLSAMDEAGLTPRIIKIKSGMPGCNELLFHQTLREPESVRPTAFVCISDYIAAELMHAAYAAGVRIPEEISLVGFGNLQISRYQVRAITSVSQSFYSLGRKSMELLLDSIEKDASPDGVNVELPTGLCIRETCMEYPPVKNKESAKRRRMKNAQ